MAQNIGELAILLEMLHIGSLRMFDPIKFYIKETSVEIRFNQCLSFNRRIKTV
jgi:hypothetical protein